MNPAEFLADLISVDYSSAESVLSSQARIDRLVAEFSQNALSIECISPAYAWKNSEIPTKFTEKSLTKHRVGWWKQFRLLLKRAWMQVFVICFSMTIIFHLFSPSIIFSIYKVITYYGYCYWNLLEQNIDFYKNEEFFAISMITTCVEFNCYLWLGFSWWAYK